LRPRRLEIEGFTSFRERLHLDFDGLDLFAITGPTGAGKSSLIDAIVFALYGQVPRVGREYKQLISHGAERLSVKLDFEVGGRLYRVARTARAAGTPQTVLEQQTKKGFEPLAGRVKEIEDTVQKIVGLDYDAFTRSVVLPQGQFDAFLKGEPKERRKILVALLNLHVYEDMHQIANRRAIGARQEAEFVAIQLAKDYGDATPEALGARQQELLTARAASEESGRALEAVARALTLAQRVATARRDVESLLREKSAEEERAAHARRTATEAGERRDARLRELAGAEKRLQAVRFDSSRHEALVAALPRAEQLLGILARRERLERDLRGENPALEKAKSGLVATEVSLPGLEKGLQAASRKVEEARAEREALHRRHAAQELRRHLTPGEPCPVCEQTVKKAVPRGAAPGLDAAESVVKKAEVVEAAARRAESEGKLRCERARGEVQRLTERRNQLVAQQSDLSKDLRTVSQALESAGYKPLELADPGPLVASMKGELLVFEKARAERDRLEAEAKRHQADVARLEADVAAASAQVEVANSRIAELQTRSTSAGQALEAAQGDLARVAKELLPSLGPLPPTGELAALEALQVVLQKQSADAAASVARLLSLIERLEKDLTRAGQLRDQQKTLEAQAALANTLAQHLRANELLAYIQEEALRRLAEDGSRHLETLSQRRYSLVVEEQEFAVVDHWNADRQRSVKTLSGGETFLASLALALALAEGLAGLAAEGHAGEALESLFLDEGFGTLDPQTLGQVIQALDALHGGERMVGVVTHIPELAAQLPARVEVRRGEGTAAIALS
jgi:exonuclease SbcC